MTHSLNIQEYGERAILLSALKDSERVAWETSFEHLGLQDFEECVFGYDSLLFIFKDREAATRGKAFLRKVRLKDACSKQSGRLLKIPVTYSGADLEAVAKAVGVSVDEVIRRHSEPEYRVRMMGFTPGFPYLDGLDPSLHLPRRTSPRNRIEPGSIAIGGAHAGIYSVASPGGWHILGQTTLPMLNLDAAKTEAFKLKSVFALQVGDRVKFIPKAMEA